MGAIVCQAGRVTHKMFHAAARALSEMVTDEGRARGMLLPPLDDIRRVSLNVALAVAREAREDNLGMNVADERLEHLISAAMWEPHYYPYRYMEVL